MGVGVVEPKEERRKGTLPREDAEKGDKRWLFIRRYAEKEPRLTESSGGVVWPEKPVSIYT